MSENRLKQLAIVWVRNDLRLNDHEGWQLAQEYRYVLPVFIWNKHWDEENTGGFTRCGSKRKEWILAAAYELRKKLEGLGSGLHFLEADPVSAIQSLLKQFPEAEVIAGFEPAWEERQQTEDLMATGVPLRLWYGSTLIHPEDMPFSTSEIPPVFTTFRLKIEKNPAFRIRTPLPEPQKLPSLPEGFVCASIPEDVEINGPFGLESGEAAAISRIQSYIWQSRLVSQYKETRNGLLGPDYSGKWSLWLSCGALSPRTLYHEIKQYESVHGANESTYWVFFELLWRDYFKYISLQQGAKMFAKSGLKGEAPKVKTHAELFEQWSQGRCGQSFCDANMKELLETGFMSNRGRQNVASYWCHDLQGDWRLGAQWFEHHLLDYDPDSNYGNWLYVAGLGNDPRPGRKFNLEKQARDYDPEGAYVNHWLK